MANYYTATGNPQQQTRGTSPQMRAEFALIQAGFAQLPVPAAIAGGDSNYAGLDTGAANAYVVSLQPTIILAYTDGMVIRFKAANANSGASTINLNALGVKSLLQPDGSALVTGLVSQNAIVEATYNSTYNGFLVGSNLYAYAASAAASAAAAAVSSAAAAASFTSFDTRYLGAKSSDPTLNNQGGALIDGALYWNTPAAQMRAYSLATTTWTAAYLPAAAYVLKAGDTMLGPLDEAQGAAVASATTTDLSKATVTGNFLHLTGTANITAFTLAAGAERTVVVDSTPTITPGANLLVPGGAAIVCAAGDRFIIRGETGGKSNIVAYTKADGTALVNGVQAFGALGTAVVLQAVACTIGRIALQSLSSTRAFAAFGDNGANVIKVALVDNTGAVLSSLVTVEAGKTVSGPCRFCPIDANNAILFWAESTTPSFRAAVISYSGTTVTIGTVLNLLTTSSMASKYPSACQLTATKYLVGYVNAGPAVGANLLTLSGTTLTAGTAVQLSSTTPDVVALSKLSSTQAIALWAAASTAKISASVITESGGALTFSSTPTDVVYNGVTTFTVMDAVPISATQAALQSGNDPNNGGQAFTTVVEATGTGTGALAGGVKARNATATWTQGSITAPRLCPLSATTILRLMPTSMSGRLVLDVLKVNGIDIYELDIGIKIANSLSGDLCVMGSSVLVAYIDSSNSNYPTIRTVALGTVT